MRQEVSLAPAVRRQQRVKVQALVYGALAVTPDVFGLPYRWHVTHVKTGANITRRSVTYTEARRIVSRLRSDPGWARIERPAIPRSAEGRAERGRLGQLAREVIFDVTGTDHFAEEAAP